MTTKLQDRERSVANLAHDLRTPLNGAMGIMEMLKQTPLSEPQIELLAAMKATHDGLLDVINDIVVASALDSGVKLAVSKVRVSLYDFVRRISDSLRFTAMQKGISFVIVPPKPELTEVYVDGPKLTQIVLNLIGNAVKFTPKNGRVEFSLQVTHVDESTRMCNLEFGICDDGCGIDSNFLTAFERNGAEKFRQTEEGQRLGGSGIGLSVVQGLLKSMGSQLHLQSKTNQGTSARFELMDISYESGLAKATRFEQVVLLDPQGVVNWGLCEFGRICTDVWSLKFQQVASLPVFAMDTLVILPCSMASTNQLSQIEQSGSYFVRLCNEPSSCQECKLTSRQLAHMSLPFSIFDLYDIVCGEKRSLLWAHTSSHPKAVAQGLIKSRDMLSSP